MQKAIKITIKTQAELPDEWYQDESNISGDQVAYYDFEEKCCIYDKIINILQSRRQLCQNNINKCPDGAEDEIEIEIL